MTTYRRACVLALPNGITGTVCVCERERVLAVLHHTAIKTSRACDLKAGRVSENLQCL